MCVPWGGKNKFNFPEWPALEEITDFYAATNKFINTGCQQAYDKRMHSFVKTGKSTHKRGSRVTLERDWPMPTKITWKPSSFSEVKVIPFCPSPFSRTTCQEKKKKKNTTSVSAVSICLYYSHKEDVSVNYSTLLWIPGHNYINHPATFVTAVYRRI